MKNVLIAFGSVPKDGGTFTFYRNMRESLLNHAIDLRCVTVGEREAALWDPEFANDGCVLLAEDETDIKKQAQIFSQWCEDARVDIVVGVNSVAILSALPHLPSHIRILSRCANAFDHGYRITVSCLERLSRIVALAPRQVEDLVRNYGVDRPRIALIPNGTSVERFETAAHQPRGTEPTIRLGFLGRLEHTQKGVLHLPLILDRLQDNGVDFTLAIAGKGVHEAALRQKLEPLVHRGKVRFVGALGPEEVAGFFAETDIFLFPSHFEGSPNALIEAMMAGCVPAAWRIEGITDFIIEDGENGLLEATADCLALADRITAIANDRERVRTLSENAVGEARNRFAKPRVVNEYVRLIREVMVENPMPYSPQPWNNFRVEPAFSQPVWRRFLPKRLKKPIKRALFRMGLSSRYE